MQIAQISCVGTDKRFESAGCLFRLKITEKNDLYRFDDNDDNDASISRAALYTFFAVLDETQVLITKC